jgi:hypothetical protein
MRVLVAGQWIMTKNNFLNLLSIFNFLTSHFKNERHPVLPGWRFNIKTIRV